MPFISALTVVIYFIIIRRLTGSIPAASATAFLLALATPLWSYSGTMFKEPLTLLWTMLAFYCLVSVNHRFGAPGKRYIRLFLAGLFSGLGFFCHVTAVLFVPFFFFYAIISSMNGRLDRPALKKGLMGALIFIGGFSIFTGIFCWLNYARFGSIWETGRLISPVIYGTMMPPWEGLAGLTISPGKGLLWFCPAVLTGLVWWPRFHKAEPALSFLLAGLIIFHWFFFSCRSDWHGGFCLGPRYLLPVIPFLLIPAAFCLSGRCGRKGSSGRWRARLLFIFFIACIIQQVYFCLGEPISFYYLIKQHFLKAGISIISDNSIYFQWRTSPLFFLLEANRGPFLLRQIPMNNYSLLVLVSVIISIPAGLAFLLRRRVRD